MTNLRTSDNLKSKLRNAPELNSYDAKPDLRGIFCKVMVFFAIVAISALALMMVTKNSSNDGTKLVRQDALQTVEERSLMLAPKKTVTQEKPAKKASKGSKTGAKRRRRRNETFAIYIYKVLKQIHPTIGISKKAMNIMNSFINDSFERIA